MSLGRCFPDDTPDEYGPDYLSPFCVDCADGRPPCTEPCSGLRREYEHPDHLAAERDADIAQMAREDEGTTWTP